jgi:hypothetical protein
VLVYGEHQTAVTGKLTLSRALNGCQSFPALLIGLIYLRSMDKYDLSEQPKPSHLRKEMQQVTIGLARIYNVLYVGSRQSMIKEKVKTQTNKGG